MLLPIWSQRRWPKPHRPALAERLLLELLETRDLLSVTVQNLFRGLSGTAADEPPDTIAAAGPDVLVEMTNGPATSNASVAFYDKNSGAKLFQQDLKTFFRPLGGVLMFSDVSATYDELAGRFALGALDFNFTNRSRFDFAVSIDSNPLDGFTFARYDMNDGVGGFDFADYPRLGYNADAYVISFNMFPQLAFRDHVDTLAIDKNTLAGHRVQVPGGPANFTMTPAAMHDAQPGDPMWLTESSSEFGGNTIGVVQMTNVLSDAPTFTATQVASPDYFGVPFVFALQPFSSIPINTNDARILNSAMRFGQIVAAQAVVTNDNFATHVRWYQFDTTGNAPILVQMGDLDQGPNVNSYFPSIDINTLGDLGMTFMESSDSEYMSMYVTGRKSTDPLNTMQTPVLVFAGQDVYKGGRAGDFSGTSVDPVDGVTFWSANEYKSRDAFWSTGIASYSIGNASPPPGSARPPGSELVFLETALSAGPALSLPSFAHAGSSATLPTGSQVAVIDEVFDANRERRRQLTSTELGRSPLQKEKTTNFDFWDGDTDPGSGRSL